MLTGAIMQWKVALGIMLYIALFVGIVGVKIAVI
jgi:hypothetical protein